MSEKMGPIDTSRMTAEQVRDALHRHGLKSELDTPGHQAVVWVLEDHEGYPTRSALHEERVRPNSLQAAAGYRIVRYVPEGSEAAKLQRLVDGIKRLVEDLEGDHDCRCYAGNLTKLLTEKA